MIEGDIFKVVVLDMQPIDPPIGGGRLRLLGLYHGLGAKLSATYIGTYDWPGEKRRQHKLSATLEEIDIPLSSVHFQISNKWKTFTGGRTVIDTAFPLMAHRSQEFVRGARSAVKEADIVIMSHPWVYPLVKDTLDDVEQLIAYDSQNFEGMLRAELLDDGGFGSEIVKQVVITEYELAHRADIILASSAEDCQLFNKIYRVDCERLCEIPNGVFSKFLVPPRTDQKVAAKKSIKLSSKSAIFLGSLYEPNIEAVEFICKNLASSLSNLTFVICGGVTDAAELASLKRMEKENVRFVGFLEEKEKLKYLWASDVAINPMFSGSGTNIKMFDFMAVGLPVVSTPIGARGIDVGSEDVLIVSNAESFISSINSVVNNMSLSQQLGRNARALVEKKYSWEKISPHLGRTLYEALVKKRRSKQVVKKAANEKVVHSLGDTQEGALDANSSSKNLDIQPSISNNVKTRMALLTTWGVRCGIAEYSKYLVDALSAYNVKCRILANVDTESENGKPANQMSSSITVDKLWQFGRIKANAVISSCRRNAIQKLNIQYHPNFFDEDSLINIVRKSIEAGIDVSVTLHNIRCLDLGCLRKAGNTGALLFVHDAHELRRLISLDIKGLSHIPHGVLKIPDESAMVARKRLGLYTSPVIGSFGFLRAHKGLIELIEAVAILRDLFPDIFLLAMNALYPNEDSERYFSDCKDLIGRLDLKNHVRLEIEFFEVEQVIRNLHACDLVALPYHHSSEGASGSANIAIASKRPVVTSREEVFREIFDITYQVEGVHPHTLAAGIANVLSSSMLLRYLKDKTGKYIEANAWNSIADKYVKLIFENELSCSISQQAKKGP